ncbi:glycosyltransferase [Candidatus Parcubacteria bacterium]|nr:MAG: glycosyltransferase [Candidatus Parcubacteria bacterium]
MKENKKILFVLRCLDVGGTEKQIYHLAKNLITLGYRCNLFALERGGELFSLFQEAGVGVHTGNLNSGELGRSPWKVIFPFFELYRINRRLKPDVIHSFLPLVTFFGTLVGRSLRVPLIISGRRALSSHHLRHPVLRLLDRIADTLSHRITVNSEAVWKDLVRENTKQSKLILIYNGIDSNFYQLDAQRRNKYRKILGLQRGEFGILSIANLIPYKGHSDLLKTARQVIKDHPNVKFFLAGEDRGVQGKLIQEIWDLAIDANVFFLGKRNDIPGILSACDISVISSHEEGFSNAILESMAAGLPVVATKVGGNPEAVIDGCTGWLVPPGNPNAMADKIIDLLKNPQKIKRFGKNGRKRAESCFSMEKMVQKHVELYEGRMTDDRLQTTDDG